MSLLLSATAFLALQGPPRGDDKGPSTTVPPPQVDVEWSALPGCPTEADVRPRVAVQVPAGARAGVRVRVVREGVGYRAIVTIDGKGERTLDAETCDAVASAVAVVVGMSLTAEAVAPAEPAVPDAAPALKSRSAPRESHVGFGVHAAVGSGLMPSTALGVGATVSFAPAFAQGRVAAAMTGRVWLSTDGHVDGAASKGASFDLFTADARGCYFVSRALAAGPCLGVEVIHLRGNGFGALRTSRASATLIAPAVTVEAHVPVSGALFLDAGVGAAVPLTRPSFAIAATGTVHRPSAVEFVAFLGPSVRF